MRENTKAGFDLTIAFTLAGSSVVAGKYISGALPVYLATAIALVVAFLVLFPLALAEGRPGWNDVKRSLPLLVWQAVCGIFLFRIFLLNGLKSTGAAEAGVITSATPALTAVFSRIFLKEKLNFRIGIGIACAAIGLIIVSARGLPFPLRLSWSGSGHLAGNALVFGAVCSESAFNVLSKRLGGVLRPRMNTAAVVAIAFALYLPLCAWEGRWSMLPSIAPVQWAALAYYGVFVTAIAYIFWYRGVGRIPVSRAGVFSGAMPIASFILSILLLGESPGPGTAIGCALAAGGILIASSVPRAGGVFSNGGETEVRAPKAKSRDGKGFTSTLRKSP